MPRWLSFMRSRSITRRFANRELSASTTTCAANPPNGVTMSYNGGAAKWQGVECSTASGNCTSSGGLLPATPAAWQVIKVVINAATASITWYVDGTLLQTAPYLPTGGAVRPQVLLCKVAGTSNRELYISDLNVSPTAN